VSSREQLELKQRSLDKYMSIYECVHMRYIQIHPDTFRYIKIDMQILSIHLQRKVLNAKQKFSLSKIWKSLKSQFSSITCSRIKQSPFLPEVQ